ncbi:MAG TPA: aminoglycoside adenylyltransferase domain-containing protein [Ktedonobacteraceae bacterium]|nr:aminoglycoside adenylyltransferase domain-containing protein [Ktedonobacteraceae bacterium]
MKGYIWATCSQVIQSEVKTLQAELQRLLGQNFLGIYLHGSLALGGFQPRRSDIDVIVLTEQRIDLEIKRACIALLLRLSKMPCPIDIRFLVQPDLFPFQHPLSCDLHYNETWREIYQQDLRDGSWKEWQKRPWHDPSLTISLATLHRSGIRLLGCPIAEVFTDVPERSCQEAMIQELQAARAYQMQEPLTFVLNACRLSAYVHDGVILSKDAGGMWGLANLPEQYHPLLQQSLALYRGEQLQSPVGSVVLEHFAGWLLQEITRTMWLTRSETRRQEDEEKVFDIQALEQWLDDGGMGNLVDDTIPERFHAWNPKARAHAGTSLLPNAQRKLHRSHSGL